MSQASNMIRVDEEDPVGELEPSFPQRDVVIKRGQDPEDYYELLSEIGRGKFGTVYHCKEKETGLELAAKFVGVSRREERRNVEREVDVMRQLQHPRLIQLYDAYDSGKIMCVVLELITGGELFERVIDDDFILTEKACTVFMRQICEGIEFVHQQNILHLDMKPENILCLTKAGNRIKIIDFGLARKFDPSKKLQVLFGTPEFVAPEVVNFDQISFGTDMWSIGVICYVLLSGLSPFMGETDVQTMANVTIAKYDFDDEAFNEISEEAKDFIKKLLVKDKQSRMTAQECVAHKWLQKRPPVQEVKKDPEPLVSNGVEPEELDVAKDNLRLFVERWSEHPNSPYLFDVTNHEITPCASMVQCNGLERISSQQSIGGCSPSPCASLSSLIDNDQNVLNQEKNVFHGFHGLERRASDSSCFVNKKADVCRRVNLAEEIKKLSDHLYYLSTMNTDLVNNNVDRSMLTNEITSTVSNGIATTKTTKTETITIKSNGVSEHKVTRKESITNSIKSKVKSIESEEKSGESSIFSNLPWVKRKNKMSHTSRDVPLSPVEKKKSIFGIEFNRRRDKIDKFAKSQETSQDVCEEEAKVRTQHFYKKVDSNGQIKNNANNTKDLLLHLLDEWGDSQNTAPNLHTGRHKSVSMEWSEAESLGTKTMNSVNTFFKRQSSVHSAGKKNKEIISSCGFK